jgi:hypothetical protein
MRADRPGAVQYVICFHEQQAVDFEPFQRIIRKVKRGSICYTVNHGPDHPTLNGRSSFVSNANQAARGTCGEILVLATDDLEPPDDWDRLINEALDAHTRDCSTGGPRPVGEIVVKCSDGQPFARRLISHPVMTRARYEAQGWLFCPAYSGMYSDNDLTERAYADCVVLEAPQIVFEHHHPLYGTAEPDEVYRQQNAPEEYARGKEIYERRRRAGFPIGPNWETIEGMLEQLDKITVKGGPAE